MQKTGLTLDSIKTRASAYRRKGVPLKRLSSHRNNLDWKKLADLARSFLP